MKVKRAEKYQGKPCKRGHDGMRYTRTGICVQCALEASVRQKNARHAAQDGAGEDLNSDPLPKASIA